MTAAKLNQANTQQQRHAVAVFACACFGASA